jgi:cephalosporin hydroxylase
MRKDANFCSIQSPRITNDVHAMTTQNKVLPTLSELYQAHRGKVSDKWSSYLSLYEAVLQDRRDSTQAVLEIGVQNGGSLEIWAQYFANATTVVGCDINPKCAQLSYENPAIEVVVGDATQLETLEKIKQISPSFDLIVEDGSHIPREVILTFLRYWPLVKPGGMFIAEDLHCDYFASHEGGIGRRDIANRFFAELVHLINLEHWRDALPVASLLQPFATEDTIAQAQLVGTIASVSFHNSIAIVRKAASPSDVVLGERVIVGELAIADPAVLAIRAARGDSLRSMREPAQAPVAAPTSFANLFGRN